MCAEATRRFVFLVDINSCYASCEKILDPSIADKPVVVLSNNDGCIIALDAAAKSLGFKMGQPWFQVREQVHALGVVARSSNYELYGDISQRVMGLLESYAEEFEQYSIDEAFLTLTTTASRAQAVARKIKTEIWRKIGVPVCVGVATSKTLAKLANRTAKKDPGLQGVCVWDLLEVAKRDEIMALPASETWGVGKQITKKLAGMGIVTIKDLSLANYTQIRKKFSIVMARTVLELRGFYAVALEPQRLHRDQIIYSRSFSEPITSEAKMREVLSIYAQRAAIKLRRFHQVAGELVAFCSTSYYAPSGYVSAGKSVKLVSHTADPVVFTKAALQLLERARFDGVRYAKAGIVLADLRPADQVIAFEEFQYAHEKKDVSNLMGQVQEKFGVTALGLGYAGLAQAPKWEMKREMLSRRGTTHWAELPVAKL